MPSDPTPLTSSQTDPATEPTAITGPPTPGFLDVTSPLRPTASPTIDVGTQLTGPPTDRISQDAPTTGYGEPAGGQPGTVSVAPPSLGPDAVLAELASRPSHRAERFLLENFHAKGGMGEIWLAHDADIGRSVALKRMIGKRGPEHKQRFLLEAQITGQLEHPGVVPVHELGIDSDGQPFYIMKFIQGRTFKDAIKEYHGAGSNGETPREVLQLRLLQSFIAICQTVAYAHSRGILHRDLKPDNVMMGAFGETLVLDWGIAKVVGQSEGTIDGLSGLAASGASHETAAGTVKGTPAYMSPEAAGGRVDEIDQRSDVYLLGAILFEMLTAQKPRKGKLREALDEAYRKPVPPPRTINGAIPRPLNAICAKAMAHDKANRYAGAAELADDMQRYLAGEPVSAYPEGFAERAWRWARRHRKAISSVAAASILLGLAIWGIARLQNAERLKEQAREEAARLQALEKGREQVQNFRRLAEQTRFYLANVNPVAEHAPYYDPAEGEAAGKRALEQTEPWGPALQELPLIEERVPLQHEIYDLALLVVRARGAQAVAPAMAKESLALLDRVALFRSPTQAFYQARAELENVLDDKAGAAKDMALADNPQTPRTAVDHFLSAERLRTDAAEKSGLPVHRKGWRPNEELLQKAMAEYHTALQISPDHYWSHYQLGRCYLGLGQFTQAAEALNACVALRPESPWGYSARGLALTLSRRLEQAKADVDRAIQLSPDSRAPLVNRAVIALLQEKPEAAFADFDAALQPPKEKQLIESSYYRGQAYLNQGEFAKALSDFDEIVRQRPDFAPVYQLRALVHFAQGDDAKGLEDLNAHLQHGSRLDADSKEAHATRGRLLRQLIPDLPPAARKRPVLLAAAELQKAIDLGERSSTIHDDLGAILENLGQPEQAIRQYSKGLELAPDDVKLLVKRGWAYAQLKEHAKALADFAAAADKHPDHAEAHSGIGYVHARQKEESSALRAANQALLHGSGDYLMLHNVACIYAELSEADPRRTVQYGDLAIDQLQRAIELWERTKVGPDELMLIRGEPAFSPRLRARPEFEKLLRAHK